jgi:hypothetical protein
MVIEDGMVAVGEDVDIRELLERVWGCGLLALDIISGSGSRTRGKKDDGQQNRSFLPDYIVGDMCTILS